MRAVSAFVFAFAIVNSLDFTFGVKSEIGKFPISKELKKKLIKTLFETYFFVPYAVEDMSRAVDIMKRVTVKPGDVIIKQGDKGDDSRSIYAIESGTYDVIWSNTNGHLKLKLHTYNNYGLFGEYGFFYNSPRSATVTAKTAGVLYSLDRKKFDKLGLKKMY